MTRVDIQIITKVTNLQFDITKISHIGGIKVKIVLSFPQMPQQ